MAQKSWEEGEIGGKSREEGEIGSNSREKADLLPSSPSPMNLIECISEHINSIWQLMVRVGLQLHLRTSKCRPEAQSSRNYTSFTMTWQELRKVQKDEHNWMEMRVHEGDAFRLLLSFDVFISKDRPWGVCTPWVLLHLKREWKVRRTKFTF